MGSEPTGPGKTNGAAKRKLTSWIESFIEATDNLESPRVFRKWVAIGTIGAALQQKVYLESAGTPVYPNLYIALVGRPGVGKTRPIMKARSFLSQLERFHIAPTSMTAASLVDALAEAHCIYPLYPGPALDFHSMTIMSDDWSALLTGIDNEGIIGAFTQFYDCHPYLHTRRIGQIRIQLDHPQLSLLSGTTPTDLLRYMPELAWGQGFASRVILVHSTEKNVRDDFAPGGPSINPDDIIEDLKYITTVIGRFSVSEEFRKAVNEWRAGNEEPRPSHPKLEHYNNRRRINLYKLAMVHSVDRGSDLVLSRSDFDGALHWLREAELNMDAIFSQASTVETSQHDELVTWLAEHGVATQNQLLRRASRIFPSHAVLKVVDLLIMSGRIEKDGDEFRATGA